MGSICTSCCSHFSKKTKQIQNKANNNSLFPNSDDENCSAMLIAKQQKTIIHDQQQKPIPKSSSNYGSIKEQKKNETHDDFQINTQINVSNTVNIYNVIKEDPQPIIIQKEIQEKQKEKHFRIKSNSKSKNNSLKKECEQSLIANEQSIEYHESFETKSSEQKTLEDDHQKQEQMEKQQTIVQETETNGDLGEEQKEASASSTIVSTVSGIPIVSDSSVSESSVTLISIQTSNVIIDKCGSTALNGEYRYFLQTQHWCNFEESGSFSLVNNFGVDRVYDQLMQIDDDFRWSVDILQCWIISDMDQKLIYYASPKTNDDFIPNEGWVCVHGSLPLPCLQINIGHETREPLKNDVFGNLSMVDEGSVVAKDIFVDEDVEDDDGKEVEIMADVVDDDNDGDIAPDMVEDENQEIEECVDVEEEYEEDYEEDEGSSVSDL